MSKALSLRVMTYNTHSCKGMDRAVRPDRIAEVINQFHPDVVALQEIRVQHVNLPMSNQPETIAHATGMHYIFYPLIQTELQDYGIALLSRYPLRLVKAENLPTLKRRRPLEKRGAIWAEIEVDGAKIQILNTHLGLNSDERENQVDALMSPQWLGGNKFFGPYILCGDFNSRPSQSPYKRLSAFARDAVLLVEKSKPKRTWPSRMPAFRIDHVFVPRRVSASSYIVPINSLTRVSSDHLPVIIDLRFPATLLNERNFASSGAYKLGNHESQGDKQ